MRRGIRRARTRRLGIDEGELRQCFQYLANLLKYPSYNHKLVSGLKDTLERYACLLGVEIPEEETVRERDINRQRTRRAWQDTRDAVAGFIKQLTGVPIARIETQIRQVAHLLKLDEIEMSLLALMVRAGSSPLVQQLLSEFDVVNEQIFRHEKRLLLATMLDLPENEITARLNSNGRLVRSGALVVDDDGDMRLASRLDFAFGRGFADEVELLEILIGQPLAASLEYSDFDHIADERDHVLRLMRGALERQEAGINILLYGVPGTGKTEFAKTLAAALGVPIYAVGETDEGGGEPQRSDRLASLVMTQNLRSGSGSTLLLFDEAEDVFESNAAGRNLSRYLRVPVSVSPKVFVLRMLERNQVPIIWVVNDIDALSPAALRRMAFAINMKVPSVRVRERLWRREFDRAGIPADIAQIRAMAQRYQAAPSLAAAAVKSASLMGGNLEDAQRSIAGIFGALSGKPIRDEPAAQEVFDPSLTSADVDLEYLTNRITAPGASPRISFCLYGPPGTGKSAWARQIADRLSMEVLQKRASDLLSMWVGGTEKRMAQAFDEARRDGKLLIFDEADSLLGDRRGAAHNWEITAVNEMLTWMEQHPLPFVCTTNLMEHLDVASLRRFTFKIKFGCLTADQVGLAFRRFFDIEPPIGIAALSQLTPGDFVVVRRKAEALGCLTDSVALHTMLRQECAAKPNYTHPIGFGR